MKNNRIKLATSNVEEIQNENGREFRFKESILSRSKNEVEFAINFSGYAKVDIEVSCGCLSARFSEDREKLIVGFNPTILNLNRKSFTVYAVNDSGEEEKQRIYISANVI